MFQHLHAMVAREVSGDAAKGLVAQISQWHRIQASPMYREAARWLYATLQTYGLDATFEAFPTREGQSVWGEPLFQEWSCTEGWLDLQLSDGTTRRLADYRATPLSLMPRSSSADGEYELVVLEGNERREDLAGIDIRGKLVLTRAMPMSVHQLLIEEYGAAGLIFDGMRSISTICPPGDLPDAIQYASWWWYGGETRAFGFALSPREGSELRRRAARAGRAGRSLRLRARVNAHFSDGAIEAVSAFIPGEGADEVLLVAHLCHPAPCANDNASGAAAAMELARAFNRLITSGAMPRPRRGLRFLWVPEMTGTFLYLAHHEEQIERTVAALNLDMVGEDQSLCGSVSHVAHTPESLPSFVGSLLEAIVEGEQQSHTFRGRHAPPLHRQASTPFSNGSDHYIFSDPTVGIPTPMIIEWPDRFYHTTADTLEKVSPATLARHMGVAGAYLAFVAAAGAQETTWLAHELNARFVARLAHELQSAVTAALGGEAPYGAPWAERIAYRVERHALALASLRRLDQAFEPEAFARVAATQAELLWAQSQAVLEPWHPAERPLLPAEQAALTPRRRFRGPLGLRSHLVRLPLAEREAAEAAVHVNPGFDGLVADLALNWADGRRTLGAILDLVELETDVRAPESLVAYFRLLERLELVALA